jgi:hypothetical protein
VTPESARRLGNELSETCRSVREGYDDTQEVLAKYTPQAANEQHAKRRLNQPGDIQSTTNLWEEENAAVNNAATCRPHARPHIQQATISPCRIVRMFLASLPPGVMISVHHDAEERVKHSHRVHAPILVKSPARILFRRTLQVKGSSPVQHSVSVTIGDTKAAKTLLSPLRLSVATDDEKHSMSILDSNELAAKQKVLDNIVPSSSSSSSRNKITSRRNSNQAWYER